LGYLFAYGKRYATESLKRIASGDPQGPAERRGKVQEIPKDAEVLRAGENSLGIVVEAINI
jgi:hypothetical protein